MEVSVKDLVKMIDYFLLYFIMMEQDLKVGCDLVKVYDVVLVCIKFYVVKEVVQWLLGMDVMVGMVIGFL